MDGWNGMEWNGMDDKQMAQLCQIAPSENWKPRFTSMSQKSKIVFDFFPDEGWMRKMNVKVGRDKWMGMMNKWEDGRGGGRMDGSMEKKE